MKTPLFIALVLLRLFLCSPLLGLGLLLLIICSSLWKDFAVPWKLVILLSTVVWGSCFIASKACIDALEGANIDRSAFVGFVRFLLATIPLSPWLFSASNWESAWKSMLVGLFWGSSYAAVYFAYSLGTTGAKAAFITALQSLVVALLTSFTEGRLRIGGGFNVFSTCNICSGSDKQVDHNLKRWPQRKAPCVQLCWPCWVWHFSSFKGPWRRHWATSFALLRQYA